MPTNNYMLVDAGALQMVANILRRSGKTEVADALMDTARRLHLKEDLREDEGCPHHGTPHVCVSERNLSPEQKDLLRGLDESARLLGELGGLMLTPAPKKEVEYYMNSDDGRTSHPAGGAVGPGPLLPPGDRVW